MITSICRRTGTGTERQLAAEGRVIFAMAPGSQVAGRRWCGDFRNRRVPKQRQRDKVIEGLREASVSRWQIVANRLGIGGLDGFQPDCERAGRWLDADETARSRIVELNAAAVWQLPLVGPIRERMLPADAAGLRLPVGRD